MEAVPTASSEENGASSWGCPSTLWRCRCGGTSANVRGGGQPKPQQEGFGERLKQHWDARTWLEVSGAARPGWRASVPLCLAWFALTHNWSHTCVCPHAEDTSKAGGGQGDMLRSIPWPQWCGELLGHALCWVSLGGTVGVEGADSGGTVLVVRLKHFALQSVGFLEKLAERFFSFLCSFVLINQGPQQSFMLHAIPHVKLG